MSKIRAALAVSVLLLVLIPAAFLPVAQAADPADAQWAMFRYDPSHIAQVDSGKTSNSAELLWRYPTNGPIQSSPAVVNNCVFASSIDSQVYCINASTGTRIWRSFLGVKVWSSPAVDEKHVYIGADDGYVYALNISNGSIVWKTQIGQGPVRSSPTLVNGTIFIGSGKSDLYCLNATNGSIIWVAPTDMPVYSSPAFSNGTVYFACQDYAVHAVNASNGQQLWQTHTGSVRSSPSIVDDCVFVGSVDGYVCCLNALDGTIIWQYQTGGQVESSPALAYGNVYVGSYSGSLYCLNQSNGKVVWQGPTSYWIDSSPAIADGNVYVGSMDKSIYCFNAFSGEKKWSFETYNQVNSSPAIVNGKLYVCSHDFIIYAFDLTNSDIQNLPNPDNIESNWNTAAFDAIAIAIIFGIAAGFVFVSRKKKKAKPQTDVHFESQSWFKAHIDVVAVLLILAFSLVFFVFLNGEPLWLADEQSYSQWAFHMSKTGDYWTPWVFGDANFWIAKPPLYMWLISISYQVFGFSNFSTRLISPIFAALTLILMYYLGKMLFNRKTGFISAIILGTFATFFILARHAMTDILFVFFIVGSIYFILQSEKSQKANWYAVLSGAFFGLALMTKQLQAFLLPLIVIVYFLIAKRSPRFLFTKRFALFIGVGLLIFVPWVIYMFSLFGNLFLDYYFLYSGFVRAASTIEGHTGGPLFYLNYIITSENPVWVAALPFGIALSVYFAVAKRSKSDLLLVVWLVVVLGLFSFAQTKLFWYILPVFPALSLVIGGMFCRVAANVRRKREHRLV
jgi:outer membrane protein assembly factor BamB